MLSLEVFLRTVLLLLPSMGLLIFLRFTLKHRLNSKFYRGLQFFFLAAPKILWIGCCAWIHDSLAPVKLLIPKNSQVTLETVGTFVINLDRSKQRWHRISKHLRDLHLPVKRVPGIYGHRYPKLYQIPSLLNLSVYEKRLKGKKPGLGEIGCYLSHVKALKMFLASSFQYGIIVEDDVAFSSDFPQVLQALLAKPKTWDLCTFELHPLQSGWPLMLTPLTKHRQLCVYLKEAWRAGAYCINRWAAKKLLKSALPMTLPWDMYYMRSWEFLTQRRVGHAHPVQRKLKFRGVEPRCAAQMAGDSEIEAAGPRQIAPKQLDSKTHWSGRIFAFYSHINRFCSGLAHWIRGKFDVWFSK